MAVDGAGNVSLVDMVHNNNIDAPRAIRHVTKDGRINVWAGGATTTIGYSGDGGSPLQAEFGYEIKIAAAGDGTLYIADISNNRIRKIDPAGSTISLVAGNGQWGDSGNGGPALSAAVTGPTSVALDAAGNLYVGETGVVRQITPSGIIGPYAGNGRASFSGDGGPAMSASITAVDGLAVDSGNNLYLVDNGNRRIRQVQPAASPAIALSSTSLTFNLTATSSTATTQTFVLTNGGQGTLNWAASASTTSGGTWLSFACQRIPSSPTSYGTTVTITANPSGLPPAIVTGRFKSLRRMQPARSSCSP